MLQPNATTKFALQQAITHHQRGRLKEAEQLYRVILKTQPGQVEAGRNLLAAMFVSGRYAEMESTAQDMVTDAPRFGIAWKGMGLAQLMQGKDAVHAFRMATKHLPDDAEAHENLGLALKRAGQMEEAAESFQRAIRFNPRALSAHVNFGNALKESGRYEAAEASYRRALELNPDLVEAHNNFGNILHERGRIEEALACYRRALELRPGMPETVNNLGRLLKDLGRFADAEACFRQALAGKPDYADAHYNLGSVVYDQGRTAEAAEHCGHALELAPDNTMFRIGQTVMRLPVIPESRDEAEQAPSSFGRALGELSGWMASAPARRIDPSVLQLPFYLAYRKGNHLDLLSHFGDLCADKQPTLPAPHEPRQKVRVAIVSSHFRRHSVWEINIKGLLEHIDRSRFELALYYLDRIEDEETAAARSLADIWRDPRGTHGFDGWLQAFAEDRPDVVLYPELGMEPVAYSLACRRLAPVQAASWGHPVTSGLPTIDLYLSGELLEGSAADGHYRERLVRLPGTGCCTTSAPLDAEGTAEIEAALSARAGCRYVIAQTPFKLDPSDDEVFAAIAAEAGGTFILLAHPQFPWSTERLVERMSTAFRKRGLVPEDHLLVMPWLSQKKFQALLDLCDVYLDCPSFSGYTTARMALQRGLPIVTLEGEFLRQRLAAGLLRMAGTDDTICTSASGYVSTAVRLAHDCRDAEKRRTRREHLKAAAVRVDNDTRVVRAFEASVLDALGN
ncbi:MAG TPA: tetratricopeptide repeat protein [Noviherbaspirillum sp.]|nr:tetratricopeptide repeat protein [Noviherbaspirillum sp.]